MGTVALIGTRADGASAAGGGVAVGAAAGACAGAAGGASAGGAAGAGEASVAGGVAGVSASAGTNTAEANRPRAKTTPARRSRRGRKRPKDTLDIGERSAPTRLMEVGARADIGGLRARTFSAPIFQTSQDLAMRSAQYGKRMRNLR